MPIKKKDHSQTIGEHFNQTVIQGNRRAALWDHDCCCPAKKGKEGRKILSISILKRLTSGTMSTDCPARVRSMMWSEGGRVRAIEKKRSREATVRGVSEREQRKGWRDSGRIR